MNEYLVMLLSGEGWFEMELFRLTERDNLDTAENVAEYFENQKLMHVDEVTIALIV